MLAPRMMLAAAPGISLQGFVHMKTCERHNRLDGVSELCIVAETDKKAGKKKRNDRTNSRRMDPVSVMIPDARTRCKMSACGREYVDITCCQTLRIENS